MNDLTAIIISFHSDEKIFDCINSIGKNIKIIVIENSNDLVLKEKLELNYQNVKCILSKKNLGYAAGNNLALSHVDTKYALIINPDVTLKNDTIDKFILISKDHPEFGIIAPISKNEKYDNLDILNDKKI
ncbi:glycosyltransferase, partial [Candidatus Pelagibacter sp.]|nr:glycosyltransferase [Candidatus Pelagibacter sp.]